jgi:hypothetical protein|tara:strand:- start:395 stop:652 length:258 start_codon:yes stop_codon:yes gene_type:complete
MKQNERPKHKTFRIIKLYDLQITHEVKVPIVYRKEFDYKPMAWNEWENKYVEPEDAVESYTTSNTCIDESTDNGEILEIEEQDDE